MLKDMREKKGLSQAQLASKAGVSKRAIQSYEQGTRDIHNAKYEVLVILAKVLDCKIDDILA